MAALAAGRGSEIGADSKLRRISDFSSAMLATGAVEFPSRASGPETSLLMGRLTVGWIPMLWTLSEISLRAWPVVTTEQCGPEVITIAVKVIRITATFTTFVLRVTQKPFLSRDSNHAPPALIPKYKIPGPEYFAETNDL